jgi:hypothetical protein
MDGGRIARPPSVLAGAVFLSHAPDAGAAETIAACLRDAGLRFGTVLAYQHSVDRPGRALASSREGTARMCASSRLDERVFRRAGELVSRRQGLGIECVRIIAEDFT